jgi:hypothetical protein
MPEPKSRGQIAYEAYCASTDWKSAISGAPLPQWEAQAPKIREAWMAAALAVEHDVLMSQEP